MTASGVCRLSHGRQAANPKKKSFRSVGQDGLVRIFNMRGLVLRKFWNQHRLMPTWKMAKPKLKTITRLSHRRRRRSNLRNCEGVNLDQKVRIFVPLSLGVRGIAVGRSIAHQLAAINSKSQQLGGQCHFQNRGPGQSFTESSLISLVRSRPRVAEVLGTR